MESTFRFDPEKLKFIKFIEFEDFSFIGSHPYSNQIVLYNKKTNHVMVFDTWHFSTLTKLKLNEIHGAITKATCFDKGTLMWQYESLEYANFMGEKLKGEQIPPMVFLHSDRGLLICDLQAKAIKYALSNEYMHMPISSVWPISKSIVVAGTISGDILYYDISAGKALKIINNAHNTMIRQLNAKLTTFDAYPLIYSTDESGATKCWNYSNISEPFIAFDMPLYHVSS